MLTEERKHILIEALDNYIGILVECEDHGAESDASTAKQWYKELTGKKWNDNNTSSNS